MNVVDSLTSICIMTTHRWRT